MNQRTISRALPLSQLQLAVQGLGLALLLAGCGGGGGSATVDPAAGAGVPTTIQTLPLQTYITDNLATDYSKVWVSIKKITAVDSNGAEVTLLDAASAPFVVNLSALAAVGQFMSTTKIPVGVYREVRVTVANSVQLVSLDGSTTTVAKLAAGGTDFVIHVAGIAVDAASSGQLVLDFNLARFTYDAVNGLVTPTIEVKKPSEAFPQFVRQQAELHAVVKSVNATSQTLTVDDPRLGDGIVVSLGGDAVVMDDASSKAVALSAIAVGARVEIKGLVTPGATTSDAATVLASVVHVQGAPSGAVQTVTGAGKVKSVTGSLITLAVDEASFLPGANSVVVDAASARFTHGKLSDLLAGVGISFRGALTGTGTAAVVLATDIDVHGAPSQSEQQKDPAQVFAAVNGPIVEVSPGTGTFTVQQLKADGLRIAAGPYSVDATHATYLSGNAGCMTTGKTVQAIGSLLGNTLTAKLINVKDCAGVPHSEPAPVPASPPASAPPPAASGPR